MAETEGKFVLRLWDRFDGWMDISGEITKEEADKRWNKETKNTKYADGDYYAIYPADTRMIVNPEFRGR